MAKLQGPHGTGGKQGAVKARRLLAPGRRHRVCCQHEPGASHRGQRGRYQPSCARRPGHRGARMGWRGQDGLEFKILFEAKPQDNTRGLSQFTALNKAFYFSRRDAHGESSSHPPGLTLPMFSW